MKKLNLYVILIVLVALFAACNASPQKNPAFVKLTNRVDALEDTTKKIENSLKDMSFEVGLLEDQVESAKKNLRQIAMAAPADTQSVDAAMKNITAMEKQIKQLQVKLESQEKEFDSALKKQGRRIESVKAVPQSRTEVKTAVTSKPAKSSVKTSAKEMVKEESARSGFYYKVGSGDTLNSISRRYGVSLASLSKANHIPMTAEILPGQSIYVPRS